MRHRDGVLWAAFAPDSKRIVTTGEDFMAFLWAVPSGSQLPALPIEHKNQIAHASWSEDGRWLVTASPSERVLRVWDTVTGEPITPPLRQTNGVDRVRFIARGQAILAENARGEGCVWDLRRESRPVEDLVLIAQLLASRETAPNGAAFPVKPDRLRPAWERLRSLYPADFSMQGATNSNAVR
jgi:WD40 repeat protein